tara:strand:+ start:178 stop:438 length:261 start_codon:yes stop_codon:yes gene_type:complete
MSSREVMYTHVFSVEFKVHSEHENPSDVSSERLLTRLLDKTTHLSSRISKKDEMIRDDFTHIRAMRHELCPGGGCELCDPSYHDYM